MAKIIVNDLYRHLIGLQEHPFGVDDSYFHFNFSRTVIKIIQECDLSCRDYATELLNHWGDCLNLLDKKYEKAEKLENTEENKRYRSCIFTIRLEMMKRYIDILHRHQFIILESTLGELIFHKSIKIRLLDREINNYWFLLQRLIINYNDTEKNQKKWLIEKISSLPDRYIERFYLYISFLFKSVEKLDIVFPKRILSIIHSVLIEINTYFLFEQPEGRLEFKKVDYNVDDPQLGSLSLTIDTIKLHYIPVKQKKEKAIPTFLEDYKMKEPVKLKLTPKTKSVNDIVLRVKKKRTYEVPVPC